MADTAETKVYDLYCPILNFKKAISEFNRPGVDFTWIPQDHARRLKAYELFEAFYRNYSRDYRFSPESGATSQNDKIFEAGDASWICNTIKAKLLGEGATIAIELPEELKDLDTAENPEVALISERDKLREREKFIKRWWKDNNVFLSIDENETLCSYLGDCAYMVEWIKDRKDGIEYFRPNLKTYDPGFVFPFFECNDDSLEEGKGLVKDRIIIAWQETSQAILDNIGSDQFFVIYRDIFELRVDTSGIGHCFRKKGSYKYNSSENLDLLNLVDDNLLNEKDAAWEDLGIDFMPIVIIPNIKAQGHDFGYSNLYFLMGLIDALINNDTDMKDNGEKLGGATVFASGKDVSLARDAVTKKPIAIAIQPNTIYPLGEGGDATLLDTSTMQTALLDTYKTLKEKLLRNSRITEVGAGVLDVSQLSTISIKLLMQPLLDMIGPMRNQRNRHYSTIFYYVQRLYQIFGTPEEQGIFKSPLYDFVIKWGSIIPGDEAAELDKYIKFQSLTDEQTMLEKMKADGYNIDVKKILERKKAKADEEAKRQGDLFGMRQATDNAPKENNNDMEPEDGGYVNSLGK